MSYTDVLKQVKQRQIAPVYLIYGTESYFIQTITQHLSKAISDGETDEHLFVYDLEETPVQEVITEAETYPFFSDRKLIIAHNPVFLKAKTDKLPFEHDLDTVVQYLNQPAEYAVIVFIAPYEKIDERKKITKAFKQHSTVAACQPVRDYELKDWIINLTRSMAITIEDDASDMLASELSTDLHQVQSELTKLALYVGENGVVTKEIAENLVSYTETHSLLRLVDAVIDRHLYKAISIYKDLEKMKEDPIGLIALLAFQFRTILRVKRMNQQGYSPSQMQKRIGAHQYVIKMASRREKQFTADRLESIIDKLTEADTAIKQGRMAKDLAFELLLYDLAS